MADEPREPEMDAACVAICEAMSGMPGISTIESCCGHGKDPFRIWFQAESLAVLPELLYWFDSCHCGFGRWHVEVATDCGKSPVTFMVEGPTGDSAYDQAEILAVLFRDDPGARAFPLGILAPLKGD